MKSGHDALHAALAPCRRAGATLSVLTGVRSLALVALALTSRGVLNSAPGGDGFFLWKYSPVPQKAVLYVFV